jgi:CRP/FNR family transcriptional regulator
MMSLRQEAVQLLAGSALCRGMPPDAAEVLARHATLIDRARGDELHREGAPAAALFVIVRGVMKLVRSLDGGRELIIELAGRGDVLGEAALADDAVYDSRAVCVHPSTVLVIPRADALAFVADNPGAVRNVVSLLHACVLRAHRRVEDLAVFGTRQRLARFLLRLADWTGHETEGRVVVPLALSRQELAALIGTTMETTIRLMTALRQQGLVAPARRGIVLPDRAALEVIAAGAA